MSKPRFILPDEEKRIRFEATSPEAHAWVSANAGSGKTSILRDRVMRLLLAGVPPDRILCLTFTKAAAAEMQNRIFSELARWATLPDAELLALVEELAGKAVHLTAEERLKRARRIFAQAVETPGGLKIQTIHAFAERILHLFPIEAGVPFDFTVLDDADALAIRTESRRAALDQALEQPNSALGRAFATISTTTGVDGFSTAIDLAIKVLADFRNRNPTISSAQGMGDPLYEAAFGVSITDTEEALNRAFRADMPGVGQFIAAREALEPLSDGIGRGAAATSLRGLRRVASAVNEEARFHAILNLVLTKAQDKSRDTMLDKTSAKRVPEITAMLDELRDVGGAFVQRRRRVRGLQRSRALRLFADDVLDRAYAAKTLRRALDFDDLIARLALMLQGGQSAWVMMKLDAAIEHILVDEAQDTTPQMWSIIKALTDDFFSGEGQSRFDRSIFVVGDEKQSIFSFQGARPHVFDEVRQDFAERAGEPGNAQIADPVRLRYSFRSSPDVLAAVDYVFLKDRATGLSAREGEEIGHIAADGTKAGLVELWPMVEPPPKAEGTDDPHDLDAPVDKPSGRSPAEISARQIADRIEVMLAGERHLSDGKPIAPGDILILCQHRNAFFQGMLRELRQRGIPVAGADRLKLGEEMVIHDLIAIAQSALQPEDDLTLAAALKSPVFALDDAILERLCRPREGSLRAEIHRSRDVELAAIDAHLKRLEQLATHASPYAFFANLLNEPVPHGTMSARKAFLARLGPDITDAIDAFLANAMEFAERNPPSLTAFLLAGEGREIEIKRDLDSGHGQIRVMTVHASKGLEARIVFIGDAALMPNKGKEPGVFLLPQDEREVLVWSGSKSEEPEVMTEDRARQRRLRLEEHRRLLYVAMTRAADRLYVTAFRRGKPPNADAKPKKSDVPADPLETNWHALIAEAFAGASRVEEIALEGSPPILRWTPQTPSQFEDDKPAPPASPPPDMPDWLRSPLPIERVPLPPLRPSRGGSLAPVLDAEAPVTDDPRRLGVAAHALFEHLPKHPAEMWGDSAKRFVAHLLPEKDDLAAQAFIAPVLASLRAAEDAGFLAASSRAEVALAGVVTLPDGARHAVRGRIDRLLIAPDRIAILDLKTGAPRKAEQASDLLRQMALYRALLAQIYPDRRIEAFVLWMQSGKIEPLPASMLDASLATITQL